MTHPASAEQRRLLLVHAHPDDETIGQGATMAHYVEQGAAVTLVTCTLGEEGEVLVDDLAHLGAEHADALGAHRLSELTNAMSILGVTDFVRLGGDGHYRDSGMLWGPNGEVLPREVLRSGIFWTADLLEAAHLLVPIIRDRRPHVLITYDQWGLYGHPDHIQAHRVAMYAWQLAGMRSYRRDLGEPWLVPRVLWSAFSAAVFAEGIRARREAGDLEYFKGYDAENLPPMVTPDADIDVEVNAPDQAARKLQALRAYPSQIAVDGEFFAGGDEAASRFWGREFYRLAAGAPFGREGRADDIFAGLD